MVTACVAVRMSSERFPGKTMSALCGVPMLGHLLSRIERAKSLSDIIVATSVGAEDDEIEDFCLSNGWRCFRGSRDDVLERMSSALAECRAQVGVVAYGDNPLIDPVIIDEMVTRFTSEEKYDWVGNNLTTTFPAGMEVEVFRTQCLMSAAAQAEREEYREHGTLFLRKHPEKYKLLNVEAEGIRRRPDLCMGIDTQEDAALVESVMHRFLDTPDFCLEDIIHFLDSRPDLVATTRDTHRRWRQFRDE